MKNSLLVLCVFLTLSLTAQETAKQIFESPKLKEAIAKHKIVAILPFEATISYKRPPKNFDPAQNKEDEKKLANDLQNEMYTFLLRKQSRYTVEFQDPDKTNTLLRRAKVFDRINEVGVDSLAAILKVDAVIKSSYSYEKTSSEGAAIAKTILFGGIGAKTGGGQLVMMIKQGSDGELLWRFSKEMNDGVFSSPNELMERMMRKVSRNFPYEK